MKPEATILVCEDQEELQRVLQRILAGSGYDVLLTSSGEEAVQVAEAWAGSVDLLMTDVVLAGMTGFELATLVTRGHPTVKVLYMSGYSRATLAGDRLLRPGDAFLAKPFTPDELLRKVREVLG